MSRLSPAQFNQNYRTLVCTDSVEQATACSVPECNTQLSAISRCLLSMSRLRLLNFRMHTIALSSVVYEQAFALNLGSTWHYCIAI
jgi:hypothetical protein